VEFEEQHRWRREEKERGENEGTIKKKREAIGHEALRNSTYYSCCLCLPGSFSITQQFTGTRAAQS
jgi:hypothetical protein